MEAAFEGYIARAVGEEIGRFEEYYAGSRRGFWVADDAAGALASTFGLEPELGSTKLADEPLSGG